MPMSGNVGSDSVAATAVLLVGHKVTLTEVHGINTVAAKTYVQLFDAALAADVTVGTTVPRRVLTLPASDSASMELPGDGLVFELGIVVASTTTTTGNTGAASHVRLGVR